MKFCQFARACSHLAIFLIACGWLSGCAGKKPDPYQKMNAEQIYTRGKIHAGRGDYIQAIKDFEALEGRFPYGETTNKAQLALIHANYEAEQGPAAIAAADRFIRIHPRHSQVDYAYYMKGVINYAENYSIAYRLFPIDRARRDTSYARQAFDDFKTFIKKFPNSKYAADARQRMFNLRNQMARHELSVAQYHMRKGAYLAAANRAGYVVNQFEHTPAVPEALQIMWHAYQKLGLTELAVKAKRTLNKNFPGFIIEPIPQQS